MSGWNDVTRHDDRWHDGHDVISFVSLPSLLARIICFDCKSGGPASYSISTICTLYLSTSLNSLIRCTKGAKHCALVYNFTSVKSKVCNMRCVRCCDASTRRHLEASGKRPPLATGQGVTVMRSSDTSDYPKYLIFRKKCVHATWLLGQRVWNK